MASELRVNTLKDASGNNSIATSFVAGGSAKSWSNFNGTDDTIRDSFNVSTLTDRGSGLWTLTVTNNPDADARNRMILNMPNSASEIYINGFTTDGGADSTLVYISSSNHGDLA